jgi:hypothetical protein
MSRYSAKQKKMRGQGKHSGPSFIQLPHYVKRSVEFHSLGNIARALLLELIDRYNGCNNGMIVLGVREAAYELGCNKGTVSRAFRELDDACLARPMKVGAWRGRRAEEYRLMWRRCDKTGDLPRSNWTERTPFVQLLLPGPKREPLNEAERARRYRLRRGGVTEPSCATGTHRHENRHDELRQRDAEVAPEVHGRDASCARGTQNGNSSITSRNPSRARGTHIHIYQGQGDKTGAAHVKAELEQGESTEGTQTKGDPEDRKKGGRQNVA